MEHIFDYINSNQLWFIDRLIDYLRRPSISAHGIGMAEVADYLVAWLPQLGLEAQLMPTPGWPLVLGRRFDQPAAPTARQMKIWSLSDSSGGSGRARQCSSTWVR